MSLRECISSALSRGAISADEAKFLLDRSKAYEQLSGSQAKTAFASDMRDEAKERARRETLQADAVSRFYDDQRRFARTTGRADVVKASYAAFENFGSGFQSFRSIRAALMSQALTEMNDFMHAFRRDFAMKRLNRPLMDDLPRAAFGENVSETAKALYQSWLNVAEKLRAQFNAAGGHIGKLENWALPQLHDAAAMLAAGFDRWRDFIAPLLDWDKIKHPVTETKIPEAERESTLRAVYESIVTDGWNRREPSLQRYGKGALYNQRDDARFLHFKDADSWLAYSRAYGRGSPVAAMVDHVNGLTRDIALMKRFGPNPAAMVEYMKQAIDSEAGKLKTGQPSMLNVSRLDSADFAASRAKYMLDGFYDAARGTHVPFSRTGTALGMFRDLQYSAKLGSSVVLHATTNPIIQGLGRHLQGHSIVQMPLELARSFTRNEADEAGLILDDALRHMEAGAREQSAWMKAREATRWLPSFTTHWTGLNAVVEASRRSAMLGQMSTYGRLAGKEFGELPARARDGLSGFGIDADLWDRIRAAKPYDPDSGRPLLRPQDVSDMEARLAYYGLLHGQTEAMVPTSNMHVAAAAAFANRAPIAREVVKSMMMFKSGFLATMMLDGQDQTREERR